ncbi:glycerate kinase [Rothia sp. LK2588]|uniref:glycerate kinase n=1 Tax=Rothia sp. LK2588 TaxID=3114369 RepID=UPI0034CFC41C
MNTTPTILIAVDKFKGTLTGAELSEAIAAGMRQTLGENFTPRICPIADGGDGTVDAALAAGFEEQVVSVEDSFGQSVDARYAYDPASQTAVIEVAQACGIWRIPAEQLDTWRASSTGVGQLITHALDLGAQHIVLGLGGSATTDGGAGMLTALGARLLDAAGSPIAPGGGALSGVMNVDLSGLDPRVERVDLTVACDVDNPLCGPEGAAAVFGPQKGASPEQVPLLDDALKHYSNLLELALDVSRGTFADQPGAGAAGGLGFAALALGAHMRPGVDICFELTDFHRALDGAQVMITGEGKLDEQTLHGKGPAGVARAAQSVGAQVVVVCGVNELSEQRLTEAGITAAYSVLGLGVSLQESLANPRPYVEELGAKIAADVLA